MNQKVLFFFLVVLAGSALLVAGFSLYRSQSLEQRLLADKKAALTPSPQAAQPSPAVLGEEMIGKLTEGPARGPEEAKVTIVEFSDFQCPACAASETAVKKILEDYAGKVRLVYHHFPLDFHFLARPAALAALCAQEQGKFWEYHDKVFQNQAELSEANLKKWARELNVPETKFNACYDNQKYKDKLAEDLALGEELKISGTPTFFVNGQAVGWLTQNEGWYNALKRLVDQELAK